jgi:hypothetical protein
MLGTLRMSVEDTIDGLLTMANALFPQDDPSVARTPDQNLGIMKNVIEDLLSQHSLPDNIKLSDPRVRSSKSKL